MRRSAARSGGPEGLRVLVVPSSYFARERTVGGGERYALEYARALSVLTPTTLGLFDVTPRVERSGRLVLRTFGVRHFRERWGFPATRETLRALGEYDVIHALIFPTPLTDLLLLGARLRRQTVVLTDVGGGAPCWSTYLQRLHRRLDLNRGADGLALLSEHATGFFDGWGQPRVILYGGAALPDPAPAGGPEGGAGYALFVGRLLPHKGVLPLIEALGPDTPLHVVGRPYDPEYLARLRAAAEGKRVRFVLDADDEELARQYRGAALVLQPSIPVSPGANDTSELLGLVALEGMAHGKPVIVTRTASLPELVVEGETGFVVPPGDRAALRERVEALLADRALRERMGAAARRHVAARFTWDRVAERGLAFYRELRSPSARPAEGRLVSPAAEVGTWAH
jgi:glycosyltransferase involved in cell wall biosynthesis